MLAWLRRLRDRGRARSPAGVDAGGDRIGDLLTFLLERTAFPTSHTLPETLARFRALPHDKQLDQLTSSYLLLEHHVVDLDPERRVSRGALRKLVRERFADLVRLADFSVIFEPAGRQEVLLCRTFVHAVVDRAVGVLGALGDRVLLSARDWVAAVPDAAVTPDPLAVLNQHPKTDAEWVGGLHAIAAALLRRLEATLGPAATERLLDASYRDVARRFAGLDTFPTVIAMLPDVLLDAEKVGQLNQDQARRALLDKANRLQQLNAELAEATDAAEAANDAKSAFLSRMSHELRSPLSSVIGFAEILRANKAGTLSEQDRSYVDRIIANSEHLLAIINDILDLAKIEAGRLDLDVSDVPLGDLVRTTVAETNVSDKPVTLTCDVPLRLAPIRTDARRLKQVLINLIANALRFTERGTVTVSVVADTRGRPLRIDVRDTGIGIAPDKLAGVFEAFEQGARGGARRFGGAGLGLSISRSLCERMGYQLAVRSDVGVGSTFTVNLVPGGAEPALASLGTGRGAARRAREPVVLLIDDDSDSRTLLGHMLEDVGCQVMSAASGELGIEMAREFRPDMIIVDLLMPGMTGWEVLRQLKTDIDTRDIPVVVASVVASENRANVFGAVELLNKPVNRAELARIVNAYLASDGSRVLIVDDDRDARRLMADLLAEHAAEVRTAANGLEALHLLDEYEPHLVLLDLTMPVMDGMTFLDHLRRDARFEHLPVVIVSAKHLTDAERARLRGDAVAVLQKGGSLASQVGRVIRPILTRVVEQRSQARSPEDERRA